MAESFWWRAHRSRVPMTVLWTLVMLFARVAAQETAPQQDWEEYADSRPFPSAHITIPKWRLTDGPHVRAAFRDAIAVARQATVRVRTDGRDTALGAVVDPQGWILTKASRLPGAITCRLYDERELSARIVGVNREYDLAMLKVDAEDLPALNMDKSSAPRVGSWLATVGTTRGPIAVGVMSVEPREIVHRAAVLGVRFDQDAESAIVVEVFRDTAAAEAGLQTDDQIVSIDHQPTPTRQELIRCVQALSPGDQVELQVQRGDETLDIEVHLKGQAPWRLPSREEFQNQLGSLLSQRRFGFPLAFQHDTVVKPSDCGGPVVNLDGEVVGFNIARAGRTETYAIPTAVVAGLIEGLKTSSAAGR